MRLSIQLSDHTVPGGAAALSPTLATIARVADQAGFAGIAVSDHVWQHPWMGGPDADLLECYATLAFLAAHTEHVDLVPMVSNPPLRHPGLLAKTVTTLDVLSGGRAWLGLGAGYYDEEMRGLGVPFPPLGERFDMLEEAVRYCLGMWSDDEPGFEGVHYRAERLLNRPRSLRRPHPPIMIAGDGERRTLPLVARYADACNLRPGPDIGRKLDVLRRHCADVGRDYDAIHKTCSWHFDVGPDGGATSRLIEQLGELSAAGIKHVYGLVVARHGSAPLEAIGTDVVGAVADW
jgi:F420-dependent oxidoreductase-like protein